jgi:hypothetical protein
VYSQGEYHLQNLPDKDNAKTLHYDLKLFCKKDDGSYDTNNLLTSLSQYWNNFSLFRNTSNLTKTEITGSIALEDLGSYFDRTEGVIQLPIAFDVLTGSQFEGGDRTYSNYKVLLEVYLCDKDGKEIESSRCSDYIIYTNSRIYMDIISSQ